MGRFRQTRAGRDSFSRQLRCVCLMEVALASRERALDATRKTEEVKAWLENHKRFKVHFIPMSSSWLNLVECCFADITGKHIRRGAFTSVAEQEAAIDDYLDQNTATAKPYVWTKSSGAIIDKQRCAREKLQVAKLGN